MNIGLYWRTIRHLRSQQLAYQLLHRLRRRPRLRLPEHIPPATFITVPAASKPVSWQAGQFSFLNQSVSFLDGETVRIDWNYGAKGKLWTYNLTYFDFLHQPEMPRQTGLTLIHDFIRQTPILKIGLESYPTSLRVINWVQFLSRYRYQNDLIDQHLFAQLSLLNRRLEYHLLGNHLLENGFALLTGAVYFRHGSWLRKATQLIRRELRAQLLADGGHEERSPVYHQSLLDRLLDCILMVQTDTWATDQSFGPFLVRQARRMLRWLETITFANGDVPMLNDAVWWVAPTTLALRKKADTILPRAITPLTVEPSLPHLPGTGYGLFRQPRYELLVDAGAVGPDHQPGHAHADTFSFILHVDNQPILVDSGTSTYAPGPRRDWERSTAAHNTVEVARQNSSEVWSGFRVGRRARVTVLAHTPTSLQARHDGYKYLRVSHERCWQSLPNSIQIYDWVDNWCKSVTLESIARYYVHPEVVVTRTPDGILAGPVRIQCRAASPPVLRLVSCAVAEGFTRLRPSLCLEVTFTTALETKLTLLS